MCSIQNLENPFPGNLNLPRRCGSRGQRTRYRVGASSPIKNVRICRVGRRSEVRVIQNVEDFRSELNVESFGNALDVIVLEQGEVQRCYAGTDQYVASSVAAKVETQREGNRPADARRCGIAILVPKCHVGCGGYSQAFRLDVAPSVAGLPAGLAAPSAHPVHKSPT